MKKSLFKVILKTKNEEFLLEHWIQYYIKLIGKDNIIIYDDNSDSKVVLDIYEKYNLETFKRPKEFEYVDDIHQKEKSINFYKNLENSCEYLAIFDTDEFLCYFDHETNQIDNSKLLPFIEKNIDRIAFSTTWINNLYYGDYAHPKDMTDFSFDLNKISFSDGKIIIKSNYESKYIFHNRMCGNKNRFPLKKCTELLLLHTSSSNLEHRNKSNINYTKELFNKKKITFENEKDFFDKLCLLEKKDLDLRAWQAREFFLDKEKYKKSKIYTSKKVLSTNILDIDSEQYETKFINPPENIYQYMLDLFSSVEWSKMGFNIQN